MLSKIKPSNQGNEITIADKLKISESISFISCLYHLAKNEPYDRWYHYLKDTIRHNCHVPINHPYWSLNDNQLNTVLSWLKNKEKEVLKNYKPAIKMRLKL